MEIKFCWWACLAWLRHACLGQEPPAMSSCCCSKSQASYDMSFLDYHHGCFCLLGRKPTLSDQASAAAHCGLPCPMEMPHGCKQCASINWAHGNPHWYTKAAGTCHALGEPGLMYQLCAHRALPCLEGQGGTHQPLLASKCCLVRKGTTTTSSSSTTARSAT